MYVTSQNTYVHIVELLPPQCIYVYVVQYCTLKNYTKTWPSLGARCFYYEVLEFNVQRMATC